MASWHVATCEVDDREFAERAKRQAQSVVDPTFSIDSRASADSRRSRFGNEANIPPVARRKWTSNGVPPKNFAVRANRFVKLLQPHVLRAQRSIMDNFVFCLTWFLWKNVVEEIKRREVDWRIDVLEAQVEGSTFSVARLQKSLEFLCAQNVELYDGGIVLRACFFLWRAVRQRSMTEEEHRIVVQQWKDDMWNVKMQRCAFDEERKDTELALCEEKEELSKHIIQLRAQAHSLKAQLRDATKHNKRQDDEAKCEINLLVHDIRKTRREAGKSMIIFKAACVDGKVWYATCFRVFHEWKRYHVVLQRTNYARNTLCSLTAGWNHATLRSTFSLWQRMVFLVRHPLPLVVYRLLDGTRPLLERFFQLWRVGAYGQQQDQRTEMRLSAQVAGLQGKHLDEMASIVRVAMRREMALENMENLMSQRRCRHWIYIYIRCWQSSARLARHNRILKVDIAAAAFVKDTLAIMFRAWETTAHSLTRRRHGAWAGGMVARYDLQEEELALHVVMVSWRRMCRDQYHARVNRGSLTTAEDFYNTRNKELACRMRQYMNHVLGYCGDRLNVYVLFHAWRRIISAALDRRLTMQHLHNERVRGNKSCALKRRQCRHLCAVIFRAWLLSFAHAKAEECLVNQKEMRNVKLDCMVVKSTQWNHLACIMSAWHELARAQCAEAKVDQLKFKDMAHFKRLIGFIGDTLLRTKMKIVMTLWYGLRGHTALLQQDLKTQRERMQGQMKHVQHETFTLQQGFLKEKRDLEQQYTMREMQLQGEVTKWTRKAKGNEMRTENMKRSLNGMKSSYDQSCSDRDEALLYAEEARVKIAQLEEEMRNLRLALSGSVQTGHHIQKAAEQWSSSYVSKVFDAEHTCHERQYLAIAPLSPTHMCFAHWHHMIRNQQRTRVWAQKLNGYRKRVHLRGLFRAWAWVQQLETRDRNLGEVSEIVVDLRAQLEMETAQRAVETRDMEERLREMSLRMHKAEELLVYKEEQIGATVRLLAARESFPIASRDATPHPVPISADSGTPVYQAEVISPIAQEESPRTIPLPESYSKASNSSTPRENVPCVTPVEDFVASIGAATPSSSSRSVPAPILPSQEEVPSSTSDASGSAATTAGPSIVVSPSPVISTSRRPDTSTSRPTLRMPQISIGIRPLGIRMPSITFGPNSLGSSSQR